MLVKNIECQFVILILVFLFVGNPLSEGEPFGLSGLKKLPPPNADGSLTYIEQEIYDEYRRTVFQDCEDRSDIRIIGREVLRVENAESVGIKGHAVKRLKVTDTKGDVHKVKYLPGFSHTIFRENGQEKVLFYGKHANEIAYHDKNNVKKKCTFVVATPEIAIDTTYGTKYRVVFKLSYYNEKDELLHVGDYYAHYLMFCIRKASE